MSKLKLLAGALVLAAAAPAAAQYRSGYDSNYGDPRSRIAQLSNRLDRGLAQGDISRGEAYSLQQELRSLRQLEQRYGYNGFTRSEREDLNRRILNLQQRIARASDARVYGDHDYGGYGGRYDRDGNGYDDRFDQDGDGINDSYDRDGNGYDDRFDEDGDGINDSFDRDGNGYDDRFDQDGDGWDDRGELGDHDPWSGGTDAPYPQGLDPLPQRLGNRYRDTDAHYYRYRDGYVYEVDRRSGRTLNTYWVGR
jgi:hypothetical protein